MLETSEMGAEMVDYSATREEAWAKAQKHQQEKNTKENPHDLFMREDSYGCQTCGLKWKWKNETETK